MKDKHDTQTIDGLARGKGRPREYANAAERQKAYRARKSEITYTYEQITNFTKEQMKRYLKQWREEKNVSCKNMIQDEAKGAYRLWVTITYATHQDQDQDILKSFLVEMGPML